MNPVKMTTRMLGMTSIFAGGYRKAIEIDAFNEDKKQHHVLPKYINVFCRKLAKQFDVDVVALNDIPQHHALWVSNHVSWLDIPVIGSVSPAFFISKAEVRDMPVIGKLAEAAGTQFIKRGSGDANSVSDQIAQFLRDKHPVIFYPEATTTDGKQVKKIHGKLLQASLDTGVPVQPLVLCYVNSKKKLDTRVPFIGEISFSAHLMRMLNNKPLTAYVMALDAIDPAGHDRDSITALLQERMTAGLKALHDKVLA